MANILVVGDGAIGLLFSHFLSVNNSLTLLNRTVKKSQPYCYQAKFAQKDELLTPSIRPIKATTINIEQVTKTNLKHIETVIFAVKAYQVDAAISQLLPYLSDRCNIVLSHNGMSDLTLIQQQLHTQQALYFITTRLAGFKIAPASVAHTGMGSSLLGSCNEHAEQNYCTVMQQLSSLPELSYSLDINLVRWQKVLINIAINPLSALHNVNNGALRAPKFSTEIINLLSEACMVAKQLGVNIPLSEALTTAYQVMASTHANYSSMQQDVYHNRATEIDSMCGYISNQAKKLAIRTPFNDALYEKIKHKKSAL